MVGFEDRDHDPVGVIVVVSVFRGTVDEALPQRFTAVEIRGQRAEQLRHGEVLLIIDVVLERGQGVGGGPDPDSLNVGCVVVGAPVMVVETPGDAVVDEKREKRSRQVLGVNPLDDAVAPDLDINKVVDLFPEGREELFVGREARRVSGGRADHLPRPRVEAAVKRDLQNLGQVEVAREVVVFLAEDPGLDAAAGAAAPGVLEAFSLAHHFLDDGVRVEERRLAEPRFDDPQGAVEEPVGGFLADLDHRARLEQPHLLDDVEDEEG